VASEEPEAHLLSLSESQIAAIIPGAFSPTSPSRKRTRQDLSAEEKPEVKTDPQSSRFKSCPLHPDRRRFTAKQEQVYGSREAWKANLIAEYPAKLAAWEAEKALHQERLLEDLRDESPEVIDRHFQYHYGERYIPAARDDPIQELQQGVEQLHLQLPHSPQPPLPEDPVLEGARQQDQVEAQHQEVPPLGQAGFRVNEEDEMAQAVQITKLLDLMGGMKYDGTADISSFFRRFEGFRTRILALDAAYDEFMIENTLISCLHDAKAPPRVGVDGERYIGPASWYAKQPIGDVDTYDKLKAKLESKFRTKPDNMPAVIARLAQMERKEQTVKDFAFEFDDSRGSTEIPDYTLIDIFTKQMPRKVVNRLLLACPDFRSKTYIEVRDLCTQIDHAQRNPDPLESTYSKKTSHQEQDERFSADRVARLERQLAEKEKHIDVLLRGAKNWANSDDAKRRTPSTGTSGSSSGIPSGICWNCWDKNNPHRFGQCPEKRRTWKEREDLRISKGIEKPAGYKLRYEEAVVEARALAASTSGPTSERVSILKRSTAEEDDEFVSRLNFDVCAGGMAFPAARQPKRRGPDTVFPQPKERGRRSAADEDPNCFKLTPVLESLKVSVPLKDLIHESKHYAEEARVFFKAAQGGDSDLETNPEDSDLEESVVAHRRGSAPAPEDLETEESGADETVIPTRAPVKNRRNPDRHARPKEQMIGETYLTMDRVYRKIKNMTPGQFEKYMQERLNFSPAIKLAGWIGGYLMQEILVDIGAECNLVDEGTAKLIIEATPNLRGLLTDRNSMSITGVAGKTNVLGYLMIAIDLGQGVIMEDCIYVVPNVLGGKKMLLGKPFLAMIGASIDTRHDFLSVPSHNGTPIIVPGRSYLGQHEWDVVDLLRSTHSALDDAALEIHASQTEAATEPADGQLIHPWVGFEVHSATVEVDVQVNAWRGTTQCGAEDFVQHIVPELAYDQANASVEGVGTLGGGSGLGAGLFAGYNQTSALEEGLHPFEVGDVTWWVDTDGMSEVQRLRLHRILSEVRPWVARGVDEMRHCAPELIQHNLHPKPDARWRRWRGRKAFSPKEMSWIQAYLTGLLEADPPIVSLVDEAEQTSPVTLALKHNGDYRFCCGYVYLNSQCLPQIWELPNLDGVLHALGGHLRFSGIDGFSGFMVIPMGEGRMLTAFVVVGYGVFVWNFMPFGLQGGPSTYSKLMWQLCHPYVNDRFQVYLDNLEIGDGKQQIHGRAMTDAEAIDAQLDQLEFTIFPIFRRANMSINAGKSPLLSRKKKTLGHVLSRRGMSKSPELVSKFKSLLRAPITKPEQVEKVFACLRYMARYIPNLAGKAKFLSDKLRGWRSYVDPPPGTVLPKGRKKMKRINPDYRFTWDDEDREKLSLLCEELDAEITLQVLKPGYPVVVIVDASPYAIACVIGQLDDSTKLEPDEGVGPERRMREARPIVFLSRVLDDTQTRWSQPKKEAYAVYWFITENRSLLLGSRIWVYCDCKPVTEAFRMASVKNKINRWVLKLQEYDFEIYHVAGKTNILADSLSRVPRDLLLSMEAEERRLAEEFHRYDVADGGDKQKDRVRVMIGAIGRDTWKKWRSALVRYLTTGSYHPDLLEGERARIRRMSRDYKLEEMPESVEGPRDDSDACEPPKVRLRLVYLNRMGCYVPVPRASEIPSILRAFHDDACSGHYAFEITYRRIYAAFFWPTLRQDAFQYTRSCEACQKCRDLSEFKTEPLRPIVVVDPFDLVTVDYSGPHNPSGPGGNTYMLFAVNHMTGWLEIMTFREATGASTVRGMAQFCLRYGYPKVLHSDHGPHFDNLEVKNWAKGKGMKWVFGAPGTAKGQGKAERAIRCIKASMRKLMLDAPKRWHELVPSVQLAFNCRYVYAGDLSPAMLLLGYQPRLPIQNLVQGLDINSLPLDEVNLDWSVEEIGALRLARLDAWRMEAVDRQLVRWKQRLAGLERGLHDHVYRMGDWVLYQNYQLNSRAGAPWDQRWRGPVRIVHISRKGKVDLYHPTADFYLRGWHTDRIRPYHLRDE
jgi:hypothetical protein